MINWSDIEREIAESAKINEGKPDLDGVRRSKIKDLADYRKKPLIIYASDFLNTKKAAFVGPDMSIDWQDKLGFIEVTKSIKEKSVDIVIHSPGGSADAVESLVDILRSKFDDITFIIPNIAKSAATMLALSGNLLIMDEMSELGPIDPQLIIPKEDSIIQAPAQAIIDQFEKAQELIAGNPRMLAPWIPILKQYGPALYQEAKNAIEFSKKLVKEWLISYMFKGDARGEEKANDISSFLSEHRNFLSHRKKVGLNFIGQESKLTHLKILDMNHDPALKGKVHAVYLAIDATFRHTGVYKFFENSLNEGMFRTLKPIPIPST